MKWIRWRIRWRTRSSTGATNWPARAVARYGAHRPLSHDDGKPVLGIVVEVQLQRDDRKPFHLAEGAAHALLTLLEVRGLVMSAEQRAAVSACTDPERLDAWIRRAATAAMAAEVFGE